ncbi:MAG: choice-of-anchor X domain-containing protein [bacterium]
MKTKYIFSVTVLLALLGFWWGCTDQIAEPVATDTIAGAPEVPRDLQTQVADGAVELSWTISQPSLARQYLIYRGDTTRGSVAMLLDSSSQMSYTDGSVRNNVRYFYRVATHATNGLVSRLSAPVSATPALYGISINGGDKYTSSREVTVNPAALSGTRNIILGHDASFSGQNWRDYASSVNWTLEPGDGTKAVYAKFRDYEGNETATYVSDDIILDTRAVIDSVSEDSEGQTLSVGDILHLAVYTSEKDGSASVEVAGVGTQTLFDDGTAGDATADDGIYELDWTVPAAVDVRDGGIRGSFVDAAGNRADDKTSGTVINIANPPPGALLSAYVASTTEIDLTRTRSEVSDFGSYLLFRSESANVNTSSKLLSNVTSASNTNYKDSDLEPGTDYYYVVYTLDQSGLKAASNIAKATTEANEAPEKVTLFVSSFSDAAVSVGWTKSNETDFESYRIYRSESESVAITSANLRSVITSANSTSYTDSDVEASTTYYYVIVVYDEFGLNSGASNEVEVTTDDPVEQP